MKRSMIIIILGVITLGCIIYGSYKHIYKNDVKWFDGKGNLQINFGEGEDDSTSEGHYAETLSDFSKIRIDTRIAAIEIKEGSSFRVEAAYNKDYDIKG